MQIRSTTRAIMAAIGAILMTTASLAPFSMISLYIAPMVSDMGSSVGQVSIALSISTLGSLAASFTIGRALRFVNPRILVAIAALCVLSFQLAIALSHEVAFIYVFAFLNGVGTVWGGIAMAQIVITQWFEKGRGMLMSLTTIVMSLALVVLIPVVSSLVSEYGYRSVAIGVGIIAFVGIAISALLISPNPAVYGMRPFGADEGGSEAGVGNDQQESAIAFLPWGKILRSPSFWAIWLVVVLATIVAQGFNSQAVLIFGSIGLNELDAAFAFSLVTLLAIPLSFLFGLVNDKLSPKIALYIFTGVSAVLFLLSFMWLGWIGAIAFACAIGFNSGASGLYGPNAAPYLFGSRDAGDMIGFIGVASSIGATIGPLVFGFTYDVLGNYEACLTFMGVLLAVCLLLNMFAFGKKQVAKIENQMIR